MDLHDGFRNFVRTPSGLILTDDAARLRYAPKRHLQAGDIFSGCGGASLGFKQAGIQVRFAVEYSTTAALTYMINLGSYPCELHFETEKLKAEFEKQIVSTDPKTGLVHVLRAGSSGVMDRLAVPGTDHMWIWDAAKLTGKQDPHDPRNNLMLEYARLICEIQPTCFTMEQVPNVVNMTTADGQPMLEAFIDCLDEGGYGTRKAMAKALEMQGFKGAIVRRGRGKDGKPLTPKPPKQAKGRPEPAEHSPIAEEISRIRASQERHVAWNVPRETSPA